jgi:hypothetical protein
MKDRTHNFLSGSLNFWVGKTSIFCPKSLHSLIRETANVNFHASQVGETVLMWSEPVIGTRPVSGLVGRVPSEIMFLVIAGVNGEDSVL